MQPVATAGGVEGEGGVEQAGGLQPFAAVAGGGSERRALVGRLSAPRTALQALDGGKGRLLSVRAVAGLLGLSTATVYRLCEEGQLPHVRVGNAIRIHPDDLPGAARAGS